MNEHNKQSEKVVAVVLTHNRKNLLLETLEGLFAQTRPLDKIIIVDSVSTDGTFDELKQKGIIDKSNVQYVRLEENKGPSGGFGEGMPLALEEGATWIWIVDDDISPADDCLETLLKHEDISHCMLPYREGKTIPFFNPAIGLATHSKSLSFTNEKELIFTNIGSFEGMLIHKDVISKIGVPDERFFMVAGDTMYSFMASLHTNVLHVKKAVMHRLLTGKKPLTNRRAYLFVRNHFLVKEYLQKSDTFRAGLFYTVFALLILNYSTIIAFKTRSPIMPLAVAKGIMHGIRGKFGAPK